MEEQSPEILVSAIRLFFFKDRKQKPGDIIRIVTKSQRGRPVIHDGVLYIGGQGANDRSPDIHGQTNQTLAKIDKILAEAGSGKTITQIMTQEASKVG